MKPAMVETRKKLTLKLEERILTLSKRRCALCFGLYADLDVKRGQVAHLDRHRTNNDEDNLTYLCLPHHDEYDTKPSQSKRFTPGELRKYRGQLYALMKKQPALSWPDVHLVTPSRPPRRDRDLPFELYERRLRIYHAAKKLILKVAADAALDLMPVWEFGAETDEALFLFDQNVSEYLSELYRRAAQLAGLTSILKTEPVGDRRDRHVDQQMELVLWFNDQFGRLRSNMAPFLTFGR